MAFFVFCAVVLAIRPGLVTAHPVALAIGYGVFVWSGLLGTVVLLPRGRELMIPISATGVCLTLVGHLIYGTVLGLFLRRAADDRAGAGRFKAADPLGQARIPGDLQRWPRR
ncbi:MAG TPA: hypothetical protein VFR07_02740 [Mycobacteriales bacterium]|jgi:hypothetical protein|nr:hypothetical protein [Mycobacteriales bacterium]